MANTDDSGDGVFHLARDFGFQLRSLHARIGDVDCHHRKLDIGFVEHWQLGKADDAGQHQGREQNQDRDGIANRPGDEVHGAFTAAAGVAAAGTGSPRATSPGTTSTRSPSLRKAAPL